MISKKPILLVGLMGSGKTTIGIALAKRLKLEFLDSDRLIEEQAGVSIAEIFERDGEEFFRKVEAKTIQRILKTREKVVLATGGGAFMNEKTRKVAAKCASSFWLDANIETLLERVEGNNNRPLLNNGNRKKVLQGLILQRYPIYRQAQFQVNVNNTSKTRITNQIVKFLET
jgi:shikimate kinase